MRLMDADKFLACFTTLDGRPWHGNKKVTMREVRQCIDIAVYEFARDPLETETWWPYKEDVPDWKRTDGKTIFAQCSGCRNIFLRGLISEWNYCPVCGAKVGSEENG